MRKEPECMGLLWKAVKLKVHVIKYTERSVTQKELSVLAHVVNWSQTDSNNNNKHVFDKGKLPKSHNQKF